MAARQYFILLFLLLQVVFAQQKALQAQPENPQASPLYTLLNINKMSSWFGANGENSHSPSGSEGFFYPRGTTSAMYSAGLMWGGLVKDSILQQLRVNGYHYLKTTIPGAILGIRKGLYEDTAKPEIRIFRIRRDYPYANLKQDAAEFNNITPVEVTDLQMKNLRDQYRKDWEDWPAHRGAPFYDADSNGKYEPKFEMKDTVEVPVLFPRADEPGIQNADQVIWYVFNDLAADSPWQSPPIGLEVQNTIWGYNTMNQLEHVIFHRYKMIYKGTASSSASARIDSMYFCQWSDPDLGDFGDDFVGIDRNVQIGYVYNSKTEDREYQKYLIAPPAVGYLILQGPIVSAAINDYAKVNFDYKRGYKNLEISSFSYFGTGGVFATPNYDATGGLQWYNRFRGFPPTPTGPPPPPPITIPGTNIPTYFWLDGDPVTKSGWIDGSWDLPGGRRMQINSGPFSLALGEAQELVVALVGGLGSSAVTSITTMRHNAKYAKQIFDWMFPENPMSVGKDFQVPEKFDLEQNYPNPFNPSTTINYALPKAVNVVLKVYDVLGKEIATLVNDFKESGRYSVEFDASKLSSGMYIYKLTADKFSEVKKMNFIK